MIERKCSDCGGVFYAGPHAQKQRFCSKSCADRSCRRKKKITLDQIVFPEIKRAPRQVITRQRPEPINRQT